MRCGQGPGTVSVPDVGPDLYNLPCDLIWLSPANIPPTAPTVSTPRTEIYVTWIIIWFIVMYVWSTLHCSRWTWNLCHTIESIFLLSCSLGERKYLIFNYFVSLFGIVTHTHSTSVQHYFINMINVHTTIKEEYACSGALGRCQARARGSADVTSAPKISRPKCADRRPVYLGRALEGPRGPPRPASGACELICNGCRGVWL